jgi:hypothetical protein
MTGSLEQIADGQGAIALGWVGPGVMYARFERTVSTTLAERFGERFAAHIGDTAAVRYFADSSTVLSYELAALGVIAQAVVSKRAQLRQIVVCPWGGGLGAKGGAHAEALASVEYTASASEFDVRLIAAAPLARREARRTARRREGVEGPNNATTLFTYIFDLSGFEQGRFTASRLEHLSRGPLESWVCVARDDEDALRLARRAAVSEWARPSGRRPEDFTVEFSDVEPMSEAPLSRRS